MMRLVILLKQKQNTNFCCEMDRYQKKIIAIVGNKHKNLDVLKCFFFVFLIEERPCTKSEVSRS